MTRLTKPPNELRPMKIFKNHLRFKRRPLQSEASTKGGGEEELIPPLEKLSQAA